MRVALALALALSTLAAAAPAAAVGEEVAPLVVTPESVLFRLDPDGGRTLTLQIEDGLGGSYAYTRVDLRATHETVGNAVRLANPGVGDTIARTPEEIEEVGVYVHTWARGASPMSTVGVYAIHRDEGLLRAPLVILENVTGTAELTALATGLAQNEATDFAAHAVPFLVEHAAPEYAHTFGAWPASLESVDTFRNYPRVYAWTAKKSTPAGEAWQGAYLERLGWYAGGVGPTQRFEGVKSFEVGEALRLDGATTRLAGAYAETHLAKTPASGTSPQVATQRFTVGFASEATGRVPLAGAELDDSRSGGPYSSTYPDSQSNGVTLGAYVAGAWTPLLGTRTDAWHDVGANGDVEQTRITSVGAFVAGAWTPLAGVRYHGDRSTTVDWALRFVAGGSLGATTTGDFELDFGAFVGGEFTPLAGATYADDFAGAKHRYQAMVTLGVHAQGYVPLLGATYDGELPFVTWATTWTAASRPAGMDWIASAGTFALGAYVPLAGARYFDDVDGGARAVQERYEVGAFLADYDAFVPLAVATYDGDAQHAAWATAFATGGGPGAAVGDWDANVGTAPADAFVPVLGVQYRSSYGDEWASQSFLTVGAWVNGEFVPLAGATYSSSRSLVQSLGSPASLKDDARAFVTVGVFVLGSYTPLLIVENDEDSVNVGVAPPYY